LAKTIPKTGKPEAPNQPFSHRFVFLFFPDATLNNCMEGSQWF